jgi:hypothetical protein
MYMYNYIKIFCRTFLYHCPVTRMEGVVGGRDFLPPLVTPSLEGFLVPQLRVPVRGQLSIFLLEIVKEGYALEFQDLPPLGIGCFMQRVAGMVQFGRTRACTVSFFYSLEKRYHSQTKQLEYESLIAAIPGS